jgi:bacteriocin-like protein
VKDESRFENLTDNDLEQVTGGMTCAQGIVAGDFYSALAGAYGAMGMGGEAAVANATASGIYRGACG